MNKTFETIWQKNQDKNLNNLDFLFQNEEIGLMSKQNKQNKFFAIKCKAKDLK